jgi:hypothetical protein
MQPAVPALFLAISGAAWSMCAAALALFVIALLAARSQIAQAQGIGKVVPLTALCFAIPLAVFGAEHLSSRQIMLAAVPPYMPFRMFWVDFVGVALIAASLSIGAGRLVRWSGLLFGVMMFLFVAMLHLPLAIASGARIPWTVVVREMSFGGAAWVLAGTAMLRDRARQGNALIAVGRLPIALAAVFFGVEHFLHPLGLPGVPLARQMPAWVPVPALIGYLTGALLVAAGVCFLLARKTRMAAAYLGAWIVFLVVVIYVPVLIAALADPSPAAQIEGLNYFADTLLFGGTILSLAGVNRK